MNETAVIIVNYNTPVDTIECIGSLLNSSYKNYTVILIDNNSTIENRNIILNWIQGKSDFNKITNKKLNWDVTIVPHFTENFVIINHSAEIDELPLHQINFNSNKLILVLNESNAGFAAANNIGLKIALHLKTTYTWLLNNDTVVEKNALQKLVAKAKKLRANNKQVGMIGSKILFYNQPEIIQSLGGKFNPLTTLNYHVGNNELDNGQFSNIELKITYPYGAAFFIETTFVNHIGFMHEDYFLFYEELDWVIRGKRNGFSVSVCQESKVYHKQGASTGKKMEHSPQPYMACLHNRNFLKFYKRFYPMLYPIAYFKLVLKSIKCYFTGSKGEALIIIKVLAGFKKCELYSTGSDKC